MSSELVMAEREQAERSMRECALQAIHECEERYRLLLASVTDYVFTVTVDNGQAGGTLHGRGCEAVTGYTPREFESDPALWYSMVDERDRSAVLAQVERVFRGEPSPPLEHRIRHKGGGIRWIRNTPVPRRGADGTLKGYDGLVSDITKQQHAEEQLLAEQIRAARFQTIGTLAAGVAHEIKNPLQIITLGLDYLDRSLAGADKEAAQVLAEIRNAAARANATVRGLLNFSATERFEAESEDWNALIERSLRLLSFEFSASKTAVVRHFAADLPTVRANRQKMEQVLLDLFLNCLEAMSQGGVLTVSTRSARAGEDDAVDSLLFPQFLSGDRLVITEVLDTGPGFSEADLPKVFHPFFTTKPVGKGTGLGLAVVRQIVELHGGAIELRNAPTGGAMVMLVLRGQRT